MPSLEEAHQRHSSYYLRLAEEAEPHLAGPEQATWMGTLELAYDNILLVLVRSNASKDEAGLRLAGSLLRFWDIRGYFGEGREHLQAALSAETAPQQTRARAKALNGAGNLAWRQGDFAAARALYEESLAIYRELGNKSGIAASLGNLGNVAKEQGDYAAARALYEESLAIRRELGDKLGIAISLLNLGNVAKDRGDYAAARALYEESLAIRREIGDKWGIAYSLMNLGNVAYHQGDYAAARALYEESLAIKKELGDKQGIAYSLYNLGIVAGEQGDYAAARTLHEESLAIERELGNKHGIAYSLEGMAELAGGQGQTEPAVRLWAAADALREAIGSPLSPNEKEELDRKVATARASLGEEAFAEAWEQGQAMTIEQAIEYALQEDPQESKERPAE